MPSIKDQSLLPAKSVMVKFNSAEQSFSYSGDIDSETEEIVVRGVGNCQIKLTLEGAIWATTPIKWIDGNKKSVGQPEHLLPTRKSDKLVEIENDCSEATAGTFAFLVCVNDGGTNVCSDPAVRNDPSGGSGGGG